MLDLIVLVLLLLVGISIAGWILGKIVQAAKLILLLLTLFVVLKVLNVI